MTKYGNQKTRIDGILFDSRAEARRYSQLRLLERAGEISKLTLQVAFVLAPGVKFAGDKRAKPALRFVADFVYTDRRTGLQVVEDVKGIKTTAFSIKRHLMLSILKIDVRIIK